MTLPFEFLNKRPIVVAIAGSNGTGKSTFYEAFLRDTGLRFVNADQLALSLRIGAYEAAEMAAAIRKTLVEHGASFIYETVLSDPVGDKVNTLASYTELGYTVVLIFIHIDNVSDSVSRVAMRASQGGHDVPNEKLLARFTRTQTNLQRAIKQLPHVIIFDNSNLSRPYRLDAVYENGKAWD